jgi:hypothetical protein
MQSSIDINLHYTEVSSGAWELLMAFTLKPEFTGVHAPHNSLNKEYI